MALIVKTVQLTLEMYLVLQNLILEETLVREHNCYAMFLKQYNRYEIRHNDVMMTDVIRHEIRVMAQHM